jgi:hypothetical protein
LSLFASVFVSKSRAEIASDPLEEPIEKNELSVPEIVQVTVSLAVKVVTDVEFSAIEMEDVDPELDPGPVIVGGIASATIGVLAVITIRAYSDAVRATMDVEVPVT